MVRKHSYPTRAVPDRPEFLSEELFDLAMSGHFGPEAGGDIIRGYIQAFARQDRGEVGAQVRGQLGLGAGARRLPGMSAVEALYRPHAPAAKGNGQFTAGEFFAAASHLGIDPAGRTRLERLQNSYGSEVPDAGGFLIPEDVRSDLVWAALSLGVIRRSARVFPTTTLRTGLPLIDDTSHAAGVLGGVTAYWTEEAAAITESQATFARVVSDAKKLAILAATPNEFIADAPVWDVFIRDAIPDAIAYWEDLGYLTGTGAGEPQGMVSCAASIAVPKQSGQAAATIVWENVVGMAARLLPTSWPRAVWLAAPDTFTELATMALAVGTGGSAVFTAENGLTIFGRPVYFYDFLPVLGTTGDLVLCDPRYYGIADRMVMQVDSSPHPKFNLDATQWKIVSRQDARPLLQGALTPRNGASNTLSAYIQIAAR